MYKKNPKILPIFAFCHFMPQFCPCDTKLQSVVNVISFLCVRNSPERGHSDRLVHTCVNIGSENTPKQVLAFLKTNKQTHTRICAVSYKI